MQRVTENLDNKKFFKWTLRERLEGIEDELKMNCDLKKRSGWGGGIGKIGKKIGWKRSIRKVTEKIILGGGKFLLVID